MKILLLALLLISVDMMALSTYEPQDQLYVWARNGLNVRSGPGTSYKVVDKLAFGDSVEFILEKDISYNITAIPNVDTSHYRYKTEKTQPYIMYGWWRKVLTEKGVMGYVISQYLIDLKPILSQEYNVMPLELKSHDTIYSRGIMMDGEALNSIIRYNYPNNIVEIEESGGVGFSSNIEFPKMTFAEVLVIMGVDDTRYAIDRNWKEELVFHEINGICSFFLTRKGEKVIYNVSCSC